MEAMSILAPSERCVSAKLQLFLRLWKARQKYEHLGPFGGSGPDRIRFHLSYLKICWAKVIEFQRAIGLEIIHFMPRDQFEMIYVVSAFIDRELNAPQNTVLDVGGKWQIYQTALRRLSYDLNPFDFGETCSHCAEQIRSLCEPRAMQIAPLALPPRIDLSRQRLVMQSA
ncbi:MAG TPA: hypothetical protein VGR78_09925 [Verrucomicrobiae bacterium]|jgi:hypothetical protein|nr:hypothetical protein [Verrucomicrobiae bacterium]